MTDRPLEPDSGPGPAQRAADPATPQVELQHLAGSHPAVRPLIAENPNAYPELLAWLGSLADPAVDAALIRRARSLPRGRMQAPIAGDTAAPIAGDTAAPGRPTVDEAAVRGRGHPPRGAPQRARPARRRRRRGAGVLLLLLLIVVGGGTAAAYALLGGDLSPEAGDTRDDASSAAGGGDSGSQDSEEDDTAAADEPGADPDGAAEQDSGEEARPAPADAAELTGFSAPSENIHCEVAGDELACTIEEFFFDPPQGCAEAMTLLITAEGTASTACDRSVGSQPTTLDYDQAAADGEFACTAGEEGFECWSIRTGASIWLAREAYSVDE